jgi:hypothetical protein
LPAPVNPYWVRTLAQDFDGRSGPVRGEAAWWWRISLNDKRALATPRSVGGASGRDVATARVCRPVSDSAA